MINDNQRKVIRKSAVKVSHNTLPSRREFETDAFINYNGGCEEYEDIADYLPRRSPILAVRLA